jgi:hypothetical protein
LARFSKIVFKNIQNSFCLNFNKNLPGSVKTSLAAAISINTLLAFSFSFGSSHLSGCHSCASFLYAFIISFLFADLESNDFSFS